MFGASRKQAIEKVDFVIAGAQKAGTTALHYFLEQHPALLLPDRQELHFFDNEESFGRAPDYDELHAHFPSARPGALAGECTPIYLYWRPAMERIAAYNPQMKIIAVLRNPIERAFSHWNMQRERRLEPLDFLAAIAVEPQRLAEAEPLQSRRFSYIDRGRYSSQLERIWKFFPRAQVQVIKYEDFRDRQQGTVDAVFRFLGVEPRPDLSIAIRNKIQYARHLREEEAARLAEIFAPEIDRLERLLGWDCADWKQTAARFR